VSVTKGYTLLGMLVSLALLSLLTLFAIHDFGNLDLDHYYYMNDYLYRQSQALSEKKSVSYLKGVSFNSMGHVNIGRTVHFKKHDVIVHLGNGYVTLE